jgi:DNA-binding MarR family transcriptional regulator
VNAHAEVTSRPNRRRRCSCSPSAGPSALASQLGIDSSTASRNLSGLEKSGLVVRKKGSDDGRQTDVRLTPRGKRAAESASNKAHQAYAGVIEKLARSDRSKVLDALDILARTLSDV